MAKDTTTFCKKFKLSPIPSYERKKWNIRVNEYFDGLVSTQEKYIKNYIEWTKNSETNKTKIEKEIEVLEAATIKDKETEDHLESCQKILKKVQNKIKNYNKRKTECENKIVEIKGEKDRFNSIVENGIVSQADNDFMNKVAKNYTYDFFRRCCISEAQRKNATLSYVYSECLNQNLHKIEDTTLRNEKISKLFNFANRTQSKQIPEVPNCLMDILGIDNPLKGYGQDYKQSLRSAFLKSIDDGLFEGKVALPTFKMDNPLTVEKTRFTIFPNFDLININSYKDIQKIIQKENGKVFLWVGKNNPDIAKFEINFGSKKKQRPDLFSLLYDLLKQNYDVCGSSFEYDLQHNDIIFNLTIKKPVENVDELDENTVVGVDVGINTPAVCALNNHDRVYKYIGSKDDFLRILTKQKAQKARIQNVNKILDNKGKRANQQALDRITKRRAQWAKNYNHLISKRVVDFALSNNAKCIQLEKLSNYTDKQKNNTLLKEWSYYQLQQFIEYKAKEYGIEVKYVNPENTSVRCSCCGAVENTERIKTTRKSLFVCHNEGCDQNGIFVNADLNAARNIAMAIPKKEKEKA